MPTAINGVVYRNGKRLSDVALDDISEAIKVPGTFVWIALHEPDDALLFKLQEEFSLHELAVEDARNAHQRPKIETYGESMFIVAKTAQLQKGKVLYGESQLFVGPNFLVSVSHGAAGYSHVRDGCERSARMLARGPGFALYALLDFVVDNYQPVVMQFETDLEEIEAGIFKGQFDRLVIERLYDLKRELLKLRNACLPVADICTELMRFHGEMIPKELREYFRDIQDHVTRLIGVLDGMREMLTSAMQVNLALVGVTQNDVVKRLAGWAAILALPTIIFSMYGMNFGWMPELKFRFGYPLCVIVTLLGSIYVYRRFRLAGWI